MQFVKKCLESALLLQDRDFRQAPLVPLLVRELCYQKRLHQILRELHTNNARTKDQHVHVVVLDSLMRRISVMANRCTYADQFVGGHAGAYATAADEHAAIRSPVEHSASDGFRKIRMLRWIFIKRSNVE